MIAVILALVAAFVFAVATVLQQKGTMDEGDDAALQPGFIVRLLQRPVWLLGVGADLIGYALQAAALGFGRLIVVQPLLVSSVVFALPLGARFTGQHIGRREILGALAVTAGLAGFLALSDPGGGESDAPVSDWLIAGAIGGAVAAVLVIAGFRSHSTLKAAFLGTAAGILFGFTAALTKSTIDQFGDGIGAVVLDWHVYALVAVSIVAFWLVQASLQTGALAPAIATTMAFDPVSSLLLGTLLLHEKLHENGPKVTGSLAALALALVGLVLLSQSQGRLEGATPDRAPAPAHPPVPHAAEAAPQPAEP